MSNSVHAESELRTAKLATMRLPELLAPAGDCACAKAAVENGADAIYFGLDKFNARMRAQNFTDADLPKLMEFLHRRGMRGYVTLNTLVFENELADAEHYLRTMIAAGVDAVIVQDVGICRLIRELSPDFPIHASTQMTITSAGGVEFARELGCNLVVLARECSLKEIEVIARSNQSSVISDQSQSAASLKTESLNTDYFPANIPLEVFVHGALCVAYSGQCLTSEALGGRSANRGECAQACRMPYELISDGKSIPLGDRKYLLSPQDLAGLEVLPQLVRAGVRSLKIEGRLKSPEYVASITRVYRRALDELIHDSRFTNHALMDREDVKGESGSTGQTRYELEMSFSRGLYTGWFGGVNNQLLVHGRFGKKRGVFLGEVRKVLRDGVVVDLQAALKPGDGVVFDAGNPEEKEEGGRVYEIASQRASGILPEDQKQQIHREDAGSTLRFGHGDVNFSRVHVGDKLWKTDDPELNRRLRRSFEGDTPKFQRPLEIEVHGIAGKPLTIIARDESGHVARVDSTMPLATAQKQPLTDAKLREQLGRLGGTAFKLGTLRNFIERDVLLPVSELNRLRREAVAELERLRSQPKPWTMNALPTSCRQDHSISSSGGTPEARLIVLVRNLPQLEAALSCGVTTVYCDFEDPKKYRDAVALVRQGPVSVGNPLPAGISSASTDGVTRPAIFVAPPRIFKTGEEWILKQVRSCEADGYLVRNFDHLKFFAGERLVGDYSLNVANHCSADYFKNRFGLERVTASYDLNFQQLESLLQAAPPEWFEVTIHQHIPMFHMEHCVFCAFLSSGTDYTNCGRPCDRLDVKLRDRVGAEHPVKADVGCRNTVFNARAQTGAEYVSRVIALGVRHFRIEFVNESPEEVERTISRYRQLLRSEITGTQLWRELKLFNQLGVTRGQMAGERA